MANNLKTLSNSKQKKGIWRFLPLLVLVAGALVFFYFDGASYINLDTLKEQRDNLDAWVDKWGFAAPLIYGAIYTLVVAFSLPLGAIMSITAGFLFGVLVGAITVITGATIGATLIFLAIQMGFGKSLTGKSEGWVAKMRDGFNRNAFSYLLVLRLVPLFPFALVNIAPALLGVSLSVYFFATFIGIIPGSLVYILLGNGLGAIFDAGGTPNLGIVFEPEIIAPILGLAALVLLQVGFRYIQDKRKARLGKDSGKSPAKAESTSAGASSSVKKTKSPSAKRERTKGRIKKGAKKVRTS